MNSQKQTLKIRQKLAQKSNSNNEKDKVEAKFYRELEKPLPGKQFLHKFKKDENERTMEEVKSLGNSKTGKY